MTQLMDQDVPMTGAPATGIAPTAPLSGSGKTSAAWNTPKHREEVEAYRQRLADSGFNATDFGDPLTSTRPLEKIYSRTFPEGTEESLRKLIEKK